MDVNVRLGSGLSQLAGSPRLSVALPEASTVGDLLDRLRELHPELGQRLDNALPVVAGQHVPVSAPLAHQQEVALLLPVAGG